MSVIVGVGEVLWDVIGEERKLGGAPVNFVYHIHQFGHEGIPVSRVGDDALGREILDQLRRLGLETEFIQIDPVKPTSTVPVTLDAAGSPTFEIVGDVAWDYLDGGDPAWRRLADADLICFGTLAQRSEPSRRAIQTLLEASRGKKLYDVNLRPPYGAIRLVRRNLTNCDILKLNDEELAELRSAGLAPGPPDPADYCRALLDRFDLQLICVTRGANGSLLVDREEIADHPGIPVTVSDAVGAGDAFTAAVADGHLRGRPLEIISERANRLGAFVASQIGATPVIPAHLFGENSGMTE